METKETDILIIGAGPCGLFTVFEAGLLKLKCHLIDYLPQPGGQLTEIYPKKPIYDIPGYPSILAGDLVENLMTQIAPFQPEFTLGERAEKLEKVAENSFVVTSNKGTIIKAKSVCIAGGLGVFEPRKPPIDHIEKYEDRGIDYIIKDPQKYKDKRVVIAGGGDSAIDWTLVLSEICSEVCLIHSGQNFGSMRFQGLGCGRSGKLNLSRGMTGPSGRGPVAISWRGCTGLARANWTNRGSDDG